MAYNEEATAIWYGFAKSDVGKKVDSSPALQYGWSTGLGLPEQAMGRLPLRFVIGNLGIYVISRFTLSFFSTKQLVKVQTSHAYMAIIDQ